MSAADFDASRARLRGPDMFERLVVPQGGTRLADARLSPTDELIMFERGGRHRALLARELAYHHCAQGELAGEPYVVSF